MTHNDRTHVARKSAERLIGLLDTALDKVAQPGGVPLPARPVEPFSLKPEGLTDSSPGHRPG